MGRDARIIAVIVGAASLGLLGAALLFQYAGGLAPCELCLYQRYPHGLAAPLACLAWVLGARRPALASAALGLAGLVLLAGTGIAGFHVGVERHWWPGLAHCAGGGTPATLEELRAQIMGRPVARCDDVPWSLFGVSMAGYNFLASVVLAVLGAIGAARLWRGREA
ncbi:MAG: disulfide bond formation protein B [Alphaproteobacteria bacterium]|nr:disulfide bond formation protein B [Alphaproteobacteria bacterium]